MQPPSGQWTSADAAIAVQVHRPVQLLAVVNAPVTGNVQRQALPPTTSHCGMESRWSSCITGVSIVLTVGALVISRRPLCRVFVAHGRGHALNKGTFKMHLICSVGCDESEVVKWKSRQAVSLAARGIREWDTGQYIGATINWLPKI